MFDYVFASDNGIAPVGKEAKQKDLKEIYLKIECSQLCKHHPSQKCILLVNYLLLPTFYPIQSLKKINCEGPQCHYHRKKVINSTSNNEIKSKYYSSLYIYLQSKQNTLGRSFNLHGYWDCLARFSTVKAAKSVNGHHLE